MGSDFFEESSGYITNESNLLELFDYSKYGVKFARPFSIFCSIALNSLITTLLILFPGDWFGKLEFPRKCLFLGGVLCIRKFWSMRTCGAGCIVLVVFVFSLCTVANLWKSFIVVFFTLIGWCPFLWQTLCGYGIRSLWKLLTKRSWHLLPLCIWWLIWLRRNKRVFDGESSSFHALLVKLNRFLGDVYLAFNTLL